MSEKGEEKRKRGEGKERGRKWNKKKESGKRGYKEREKDIEKKEKGYKKKRRRTGFCIEMERYLGKWMEEDNGKETQESETKWQDPYWTTAHQSGTLTHRGLLGSSSQSKTELPGLSQGTMNSKAVLQQWNQVWAGKAYNKGDKLLDWLTSIKRSRVASPFQCEHPAPGRKEFTSHISKFQQLHPNCNKQKLLWILLHPMDHSQLERFPRKHHLHPRKEQFKQAVKQPSQQAEIKDFK